MNFYSIPRSAAYLCVCLLIIPSGAYLTKFPISPIYPAAAAGLMILAYILTTPAIRAEWTEWAELFAGLCMLLCIGVMQISSGGALPNILNLLLGPLLILTLPTVGSSLDRSQLLSVSKWHAALSLAIISIECIYRILNPDVTYLEEAASVRGDVEDIAFYIYKFNSLMYIDSNFVGLQLAILFAFLSAINTHHQKINRWIFVFILLLTCLTISRASLITIAVLAGIGWSKRLGSILRLIIGSILLGAIGATIHELQQDTSFLTKFDILARFFNFLLSGRWHEILLGVGAGQAAGAIGIGAHNIVVSYGTELGVPISTVILLYWIWICTRTRGAYLLFVAWLLNGFSLTTLAIPYLYAATTILRLLDKHPRVQESQFN